MAVTKRQASSTARVGFWDKVEGGFDASGEVGACAPFGFWDPVGLTKDGLGNWKSEAQFRVLREAEVKHGRVAMVAAVGLVAGSIWRFPGFDGAAPGIAALENGDAAAGFGALVVLAGAYEFSLGEQDPAKPPGDHGDWLNVTDSESYRWLDSDKGRLAELNHGRLAMPCVFSSLLTEYGTGMGPSEQFQYMSEHGWLVFLPFALLVIQQTPEDSKELYEQGGVQALLDAPPPPLPRLPGAPPVKALKP